MSASPFPPESDHLETSPEAPDFSSLDARISEAQDVQPEPLPPAEPSPEPPPEHQPATAMGEKGNAARAETGAEKPEVKIFHGGSPEGGW